MSKPSTPSGNIPMSRIKEIAMGVARYAGRYTGNETFLGYNLQEVTPLLPEHEESIPPDGQVKIVFDHWSVVDDRVAYHAKNRYPDPETIDHRVMSYVARAEDVIEYQECLNGPCDPGDLLGEFDLVDWSDDWVSGGRVPDDVVEELCEFLKEQRADYLAEEFGEAFKKGELPEWDPRITKVVEEDCRKSLQDEEEYEAYLKTETPQQKNMREERFRMQSRMVSACWITREFNDTLASIKLYKGLRDWTEDPEERRRFQEHVDYLIGSGMVTEEDVALSEKHDKEASHES
ncbi:MAG: hypothetical protein WCI42_03640 [Verrucomicrobiota bacterium]